MPDKMLARESIADLALTYLVAKKLCKSGVIRHEDTEKRKSQVITEMLHRIRRMVDSMEAAEDDIFETACAIADEFVKREVKWL